MRGKQLFGVLATASLFIAAGCGGPQNTGDDAAPLPGTTQSPSVTPSPTKPTTAKPSVTKEPVPTVTVTVGPRPPRNTPAPTKPTPTTTSCPNLDWDAGLKEPEKVLPDNGPILTSGVTWERCFDRFTVTIQGAGLLPYFRAEYVDRVYKDGSGDLLKLKGKAFFQLIVRHPVTDTVVVRPDRGKMIQQVRSAGSFEGQTTYGIGIDAVRDFDARVILGATPHTTRVMVTFAR